jgi:hypothetical protein
MDRPHILRLLRIAFSVACGVVCLLLIVLWIRSNWSQESLSLGTLGGWRIWACSVKQHIILSFSTDPSVLLPSLRLPPAPRWSALSLQIEDFYQGKTEAQISRQIGIPKFPGFDFQRPRNGGFRSVIPHWFAVLVFATLGAMPLLQWSRRFSLRTLLITTTLVAVVLGLAVAMC